MQWKQLSWISPCVNVQTYYTYTSIYRLLTISVIIFSENASVIFGDCEAA